MSSVLIQLKGLLRAIFTLPAGFVVQICNDVIVKTLGNEMFLFE